MVEGCRREPESKASIPARRRRCAVFNHISPGYLRTMGMSLRRAADLEPADVEDLRRARLRGTRARLWQTPDAASGRRIGPSGREVIGSSPTCE